ncbi:hypothetical protein BB561_004925 [Smittium simulii]|uniref:RAVE complex protein Rav1 C-terminal domain-containing protein n=1 Tax=Smittium simulii TaxID=133385 RepID=A0A2T9YDF2_9FUNG|nr:hypothetical protein BB561_004925 [Smittium simulii]
MAVGNKELAALTILHAIIYPTSLGQVHSTEPEWKPTFHENDPGVIDNFKQVLVSPQGNKKPLLKTKSLVLSQKNINFISWGSMEPLTFFVSFNKELHEYTFKDNIWLLTWSCSLARPLTQFIFSKSARYFITFCGYDRLPKLWKKSALGNWDFQYLAHNRRVLYAFWGNQIGNSEKIYTFCADNHLRIWEHIQKDTADFSATICTTFGSFFFPINAIDATCIKIREKSLQIISRFCLLDSNIFLDVIQDQKKIDKSVSNFDTICCILDDGSVFGYIIMNNGLYRPLKPVRLTLSQSSPAFIPKDSNNTSLSIQSIYTENNVWILLTNNLGKLFLYNLPFLKNGNIKHDMSQKFDSLLLKSVFDGHNYPLDLILHKSFSTMLSSTLQDGLPKFFSKDVNGNGIIWNYFDNISPYLIPNTLNIKFSAQSQLIWTPRVNEIIFLKSLDFQNLKFNPKNDSWELSDYKFKLKNSYDFAYVAFLNSKILSDSLEEAAYDTSAYTIGFLNKTCSTVEFWSISRTDDQVDDAIFAKYAGISILQQNKKKEKLDNVFFINQCVHNFTIFACSNSLFTINYDTNIITKWDHYIKLGRTLLEPVERYQLSSEFKYISFKYSPENKIIYLSQKENSIKEIEYYVISSNLPTFNNLSQNLNYCNNDKHSNNLFASALDQTVICKSKVPIIDILIYFSKNLITFVVVKCSNSLKIYVENLNSNKEYWVCIVEINTTNDVNFKIGDLVFLNDLEFIYNTKNVITLVNLNNISSTVNSLKNDSSNFQNLKTKSITNIQLKSNKYSQSISSDFYTINSLTDDKLEKCSTNQNILTYNIDSANLNINLNDFNKFKLEQNSLNISDILMKLIQWNKFDLCLNVMSELSSSSDSINHQMENNSISTTSNTKLKSGLFILIDAIYTVNNITSIKSPDPKTDKPLDLNTNITDFLNEDSQILDSIYQLDYEETPKPKKNPEESMAENLETLNFSKLDARATSILYYTLKKNKSKANYIDDCAEKFLIFFEFNLNFHYKIMINFREATWAMLSNSQSIIFDSIREILTLHNLSIEINSWNYIKSLAVPLWLNDHSQLCKILENSAKYEYSTNRNIYLVSVLYMIFNRKSLVLQLWRTEQTHPDKDKIINFLKNDFSIPRWKSAAVKNAFALLNNTNTPELLEIFVKDQILPKMTSATNSWLLASLMIRINRYDMCLLVAADRFDLLYNGFDKKFTPSIINSSIKNYTHLPSDTNEKNYFLSSNMNSELILLLDTLYYNQKLKSYNSELIKGPSLNEIRNVTFCKSLNKLIISELAVLVPVAIECFTTTDNSYNSKTVENSKPELEHAKSDLFGVSTGQLPLYYTTGKLVETHYDTNDPGLTSSIFSSFTSYDNRVKASDNSQDYTSSTPLCINNDNQYGEIDSKNLSLQNKLFIWSKIVTLFNLNLLQISNTESVNTIIKTDSNVQFPKPIVKYLQENSVVMDFLCRNLKLTDHEILYVATQLN